MATAGAAGPESVAVAFNDCINPGDLNGLAAMMTPDHTFIDTAGGVFAGEANCVAAWRGFFDSFPDYRNVFTSMVVLGETVTIVGHSVCSEPSLSGLALWTATIRNGRVARWLEPRSRQSNSAAFHDSKTDVMDS